MKILFLMRHAKSSWNDASLSDFDRPLNPRGLIAAPFMGKLMRSKGYVPAAILSSSAVRTKQTAELVKEAAGFEAAIDLEPSIYEASPNTIKRIIASIDDKYDSLMLVGHNPGVEGTIFSLTGIIESMPTAALAVIELNIEKWTEVKDSCGSRVNVFRPKDEIH